MTPPKGTKSGPNQPESQDIPKKSTESQSAAASTEVHKEARDHFKDNVSFIKQFEAVKLDERKELWKKAAEWEKDSDIPALRAAGLSLDQLKADSLARHVRLAAMILKREPGTDPLAFKCDFSSSDFMALELDVSDVMPANVLAVDILDEEGKVMFENARRGVKDGKPGYYTEPDKKRAILRQGFTIKVKETQSSVALTHQTEGKQTYINGLAEETYLTKNDHKNTIGKAARAAAAKSGKEVKLDGQTTDGALEDAVQDVIKDGKFDISKLEEVINKLIEQFGTIISSFTEGLGGKAEKKEAVPEGKAAEEKKAKNTNGTGKSPQRSGNTSAQSPSPTQTTKPAQAADTGPEETAPTGSDAETRIRTAKSYIGSENFRGPEVRGGSLACAQFVSRALTKSKDMGGEVLSVTGVEQRLLRQGWTRAPKGAGPSPGDVVIWGFTKGRVVDGIARPGHRHIGIMSSTKKVVHNNSNNKTPEEKELDKQTPRGLTYLRPPSAVA